MKKSRSAAAFTFALLFLAVPLITHAAITVTYAGASGLITASGGSGSATINLGTHASDYVVVVIGSVQSTPGFSGVTVGSTALSEDVAQITSTSPWAMSMWSGLVSSSVSGNTLISFTGSGNFNARQFQVYTLDGASAGAITGGYDSKNFPSVTLGVTSGQVLIGGTIANNNTGNFTASTVAPDHTNAAPSGSGSVADWAITSTNASFAVTSSLGNASAIAATYAPAAPTGSTRIIRLLGHVRLGGGVRLF